MDLEWNEQKGQETIALRGVDVLYAALIFEGVVFTQVDDRRDYGEVREISLGMVGGEAFVVVHTRRGEVTRLITAWKGGLSDRLEYEARVALGYPKDEGSG